MNKKLKLSKEEGKVVEDFRKGELVSTSPKKSELKHFQNVARKGLQKDKRINIRIPSEVLNSIQDIAAEEGLPYQTLIASVLFKYSSGRLVDVKGKK